MSDKPELAVILHNVRSLHNVGSIFRTADGAGFKKIYLCGITPEPVDRFGNLRSDFAKVALGAEKDIDWEKRPRISSVIAHLKKSSYKIYAVEQDSRAIPLGRWPKARRGSKIALIMGAEVEGLPRSVLNRADGILEIPMRGSKESLNVSVAFGVAAYGIGLR